MQPHALLAVVGPVRETDTCARQNKQSRESTTAADGLSLGLGIKLGISFVTKLSFMQAATADSDEAKKRRNQQRHADFGGLRPVDAAGGRPAVPETDWQGPTPMIEPIRVCELEAGSPRYQVSKIPQDGAVSSANTMARPALEPTCRMSSTGNSKMMPKATAPLDGQDAEKIEQTRPDDSDLGGHRVGVDHRCDGVCGIVKPVDEFETERDEQSETQEQEGQPGCGAHAASR